jgi:guanosine-3',5'-bis(diphosphate) 3'-pyrophosphohydrolase
MEMEDKEVGLLLSAIKIAARQHSSQRRKDRAESPYINHPIQVMNTLWGIGGVRDVEVLVAALLHDTLEDTVEPGTEDETKLKNEISREFGVKVLDLVEKVSDNKRELKKVRKQHQIEHAFGLPYEAKLIKLADKINNIQDVIANPPGTWGDQRKMEYLDWAEKVVAGLRGVNASLEQKFDEELKLGIAILKK